MIGVFDSGVGGLSVLKELKKQAPMVDVVYFGDVGHMPYGLKHPDTLQLLTLRIIKWLKDAGATHLVSACNSVSASVIRPMFDLFGVTDSCVIEMVGPAVDYLAEQNFSRVAVVATPATVNSGVYQEGLTAKGISSQLIPCSRLASAIEFGASEDILMIEIKQAVEAALNGNNEALVLGCTHYAFVKKLFEKVLLENNSEMKIFDPAKMVASRAIQAYGGLGQGKIDFVLSAESKKFSSFVSELFPEQLENIRVIDFR